jgi:hypothetical protein
MAQANDLLMDNLVKIESGLTSIPSLTQSFIESINSTVVAHLQTLGSTYHDSINDSDCKAKIHELADSFTITQELTTIVTDYFETTLLLKAVSIGERMIREIEVSISH